MKPMIKEMRGGSSATYHSDIQWASSTTTRDINKVLENIDENSAFKNLSGETNSTWYIMYKVSSSRNK